MLAAMAFFSSACHVVTPANPGAFFLTHMPVSEAGWAAFCSRPTDSLDFLIDLFAVGNHAVISVGDLRDASLEDLIYHHRTRLVLSSMYAAWGWLAAPLTPPSLFYRGSWSQPTSFYQRVVCLVPRVGCV